MKRSKRNSPCKEASSNAASSSSKNAGTPEGSKEIINCENNTTIASRETRAVNFLRILVLVLLGMTACLTSIGIYRYTQSHEVEMFETEYEMNAYRIIEYFNDAVERKLAAINAMSTSITSSALDAKEEFPFVTIPDFALKGADLRIQADAITIHWMPLVTDETREEWETYSLENRQQIDEAFLEDKKHRIKQDIEFGLSDGDRLLQESPRNETILDDGTGFHPRIYSNGATVPKGDEEDGSGPYLPLWQRR